MSRIRTEFQRMARAGVPQEKVDEVDNQACRMVREMTQNAGDLKKLHLAVSLMAKETIKGKNPAEVGEKIRQNFQKCNNLNQALSQTKEQIREQDRMEQKAQSLVIKGHPETRKAVVTAVEIVVVAAVEEAAAEVMEVVEEAVAVEGDNK